MEYNVSTTKKELQGLEIQQLLKKCGMGTYTPELHQKAFEKSYKIVQIFTKDHTQLIGCGRVLSDCCYQAAVYDVAIDPDYQGTGLGRLIMENLLKGMEQLNVMLYASPGKEAFYQKFGFRLGKTAMLKFVKADVMKENGLTD